MKKLASLVLASAMAVVPFAAGLAATFTPGEYEATAQGFAGAVTVKVTVDEAYTLGNAFKVMDRRKRDPGAGRRCDRGL